MNSNKPTLVDKIKLSSSARLKLPFLFWLGMLTFALLVWVLNSFMAYQNQARISQSAELSVNSLSSFVSDYIEKRQMMVKSVVRHHQESIVSLAEGGGYLHNFSALKAEFSSLFPTGTEFAVIGRNGQIIQANNLSRIGPNSKAYIEKSMAGLPASFVSVEAHQSSAGESHFDMLFPIVVAEDYAGLWVKFSFEPIEEFINSLNINEYELIISEQTPPYSVILGKKNRTKSLELKFDFIEDAAKDELNTTSTLALSPVKGVPWQVRALPNEKVMKNYRNKILITSIAIFLIAFVLIGITVIMARQFQIEREKLKKDAEHDELFNAGPTILFEKSSDRSMLINYASPNAFDLLGKRSNDILGQPYLDWIYPEDIDLVRQHLLEAYRKKQRKVELVYRINSLENGGFKWIYDFTHIKYNLSGNPESLRGYITSIHAQKMAEKNAIDLIQSVPEAIYVTDLDGCLLKMNFAAEKLLDLSQAHLEEYSFNQFLDEESLVRFERSRKSFIKSGSINRSTEMGTLKLETMSGKKLSVDISMNKIEINDDEVFILVVRDVTLQVRTQKQLSDAKEQAESLARARSRFVATISHEIRTPMNGVLGMADLLSETELTSLQERYLNAIKQSGKTLLQIINEVLDFAKLDEGHITLINESFDLCQLVNECLHLLSVQAEDKGLELELDYSSDINTNFIGDANRIKQLLLNLISNAIKFTEAGKIELIVNQSFDSTGHLQTVNLHVIDTGIGIETTQLDRLFDSFTQADDSTSRKFGGTGLGLAISKQLVDLMGGEIGVKSELEEGSEFWVRLSLKAADTEFGTELPQKNIAFKLDNKAKPLQGKTVLIVEDNEINQSVIEAFLKRLGAKVDITENGLKGVDFWRMNPKRYQLILMDIQMPIMDGLEATRIIRQEEAIMQIEPQIPILALTANVVMEDRNNCLQAGMNEFMAKPIDRDLFDSMVAKWCL